MEKKNLRYSFQFDFSATTMQDEEDVRLDGKVILKKDTFRYLGSML
jgi:hypothetical protein